MPSSYLTGRHGARAAYDLLAESGYKVERWEQPLSELAAQTNHGTVVILVDPYLTLTRDFKAVDQILERGGRILVTGMAGGVLVPGGAAQPTTQLMLLHAVAALRDRGMLVDLAIAGHGSYEPILRALAKKLRTDAQIRFFGTLAQEDLADLLRASDTFAIMSTSETQSMVLLQAMASGVPVVAANSRALPEFVSAANGVLVDPHDVTQLTQVLADLLVSPAQCRQMGTAGRQCAERYRVETITDEWEALYRSVLHGSEPRE